MNVLHLDQYHLFPRRGEDVRLILKLWRKVVWWTLNITASWWPNIGWSGIYTCGWICMRVWCPADHSEFHKGKKTVVGKRSGNFQTNCIHKNSYWESYWTGEKSFQNIKWYYTNHNSSITVRSRIRLRNCQHWQTFHCVLCFNKPWKWNYK